MQHDSKLIKNYARNEWGNCHVKKRRRQGRREEKNENIELHVVKADKKIMRTVMDMVLCVSSSIFHIFFFG